MRRELQHPPIDEAVAAEAVRRAQDLYRRHEAGHSYEAELRELSTVCGVEVDAAALDGAFGSIPPESFAMELMVSGLACPSDLSDEELVELIRAVCNVEGEEWQSSYWLRCLEVNTGCAEIIDLIYYPHDVLGDGDDRDELSPEEVLAEARKRPGRVLMTPPPE